MVTTIFTTDGVYVPTMKTRALRVLAYGAGGGGAGGNARSSRALGGGGGGGGGATLATIDVRKHGALAIRIGQGGAAGLAGQDGLDGGDTSVGGPQILLVPGGKGGLALPGQDGLQGGKGGRGVSVPGQRVQKGGDGGTWPYRFLYSLGGGGGAAGNSVFPGISGGAPQGGFTVFPGDGSGAGGNGATPYIPSLHLSPQDAQAGDRAGGGGGGGQAITPTTLHCTGFNGGNAGGVLIGANYFFNVTLVADWHTLVSSDEPDLEVGLSIGLVIDNYSPWANEGGIFAGDVTFSGNSIVAIGNILFGFSETISGHVYAFDELGGRSADAPWSFTEAG
jgi:hypothetical protein